MNIDERIEALKLAMELLARQDGEKIRALLRMAESRERI